MLSVCLGTIGYIHYAQNEERVQLARGVTEDLRRQEAKRLLKAERELGESPKPVTTG